MKELFLIIFLFLNLSHAHARTTLEDLDTFVVNAGGASQIFRSRHLKTEYYRRLNDYFDGKLSRLSFEFIFSDIMMLVRARPMFESLLWKSNLPASGIEFQGLKGNEEKNVDMSRWLQFIHDFQTNLKAEASSISLENAKALIQKYEFLIAVQDHDTNPVGLNRRRINFYETLKQNSEFKTLISFLAQEVLRNMTVQANLRSGNFEIISEQLIKFSNKSYLESELKQKVSISRISSFVIKALPQYNILKANENYFPPLTREGRNSVYPIGRTQSFKNYRSVPVQPLHAVFTGAIHRECSGGDPGAASICLLPSRWGLSLLPSTVTHFFEVEGRYNGVVRFIPFKNLGAEVMSLDMMVPEFNRRFKEVLSNGHVKWTTVFDLWLEHQLEVSKLPLVVSQSEQGRNAGNSVTKLDSSGFRLGKKLGPAKNYNPVDTIESFSLISFTQFKAADNDKDSLQTELSNLDAGEVIQLNRPIDLIYDPKYISDLAAKGDIVGLESYVVSNKFSETLTIYLYEQFLTAIKDDIVLKKKDLLSFHSFYLKFNGVRSHSVVKSNIKKELFIKAQYIWLRNSFLNLSGPEPIISPDFNKNVGYIVEGLDSNLAFTLIENELAKVKSPSEFKSATKRDFYLLMIKLSLEPFKNVELTAQATRVQSIIEKSFKPAASKHNFGSKSCRSFLESF